MFNFERYKFSEEVKDNLADFLNVAQKHPSPARDKVWEILLPKNLELMNELETIIFQNKSVIDLTEGDSFSKNLSKANDHIDPDVSDDDILEIISDFNEKLNQSSIKNIASSLRDLSSEEEVEEIFDEVTSSFGNNEIEEVFSMVSGTLSSEQVFKVGNCIFNKTYDKKIEISRFYLKYLLLPQIIIDNNKQLISIFIKYLESFLSLTCEEFSEFINKDVLNFPHSVIHTLSDLKLNYKQQLLRTIMLNCTKLYQSHLSIIESLLHPDLQIDTLKSIMGLFINSSSTYSEDKVFGKLLLNVIKSSRSSIMHFKQEISTVIAGHQSVWKSSLEKEFEECLVNNSMFSQSLRY